MRALVTRLLSTVVAALALVGVLGVVGVASATAGECPNEQVRSESNVNPTTGESYDMGLPECRAYEKVSPNDKAGHDAALREVSDTFVSPNGDAVDFVSTGSFAGSEGVTGLANNNPYQSTRDSFGWDTRSEFLPASIAPAPLGFVAVLPWPSTPDLSRAVVCGEAGEDSANPEPAVICAIHERDGSWIVSQKFPDTPDVPTKELNNVLAVSGASSNLSHIFFILNVGRLLGSDSTTVSIRNGVCHSGIYEVSGLGTSSPVTLRLVNVDNSGTQIGITAAQLGNSCQQLSGGTAFHAVSENGQTAYFEATPVNGVQTVYARLEASHTVAISEPSVADCATCQTAISMQKPGIFQGASADGSKVFFTTEQELLPGRRSTNLYEYEMNAPAGQRVTAVTTGSTKAEVQGVVGESGDGTHIYFVAKSVLTSEPNETGQEAQFGADNFYVYERDTSYPSGRTAFIGMLCSSHNLSGVVPDSQCASTSPNDESLWTEVEGSSAHREQITKTGNYVVFETNAHLSPEDTNEAPGVYRYDAATGELSWVSHPAAGFSGHVNEGMASEIPARENSIIGALPSAEDSARTISEDGKSIVFVTNEVLQADDMDKGYGVYLWHDGIVSMISDGHAPDGAKYKKTPVISASGSDIFFHTRTRLVGQDIDENLDVYDARVDGGFPAPAIPPTECGLLVEGEACQGSPSSLPIFIAPGTVSFTGGMNVTLSVVSGKLETAKPKSKLLTRAQKLAEALRACNSRPKKKRASCKAAARKKYGARSKTGKSKKSNRRGN